MQQYQPELTDAEMDAKMLATRYGIKISSFAGIAPGAIHSYGEAWRYDGDKTERHDLERIIGEADAKRLNRLDETAWGGPFRWKPGMKTNRFDSEEAVIQAGIAVLLEKYGDEIVVVELGASYELDSPEIHLPQENE